MKVEFVTFSKIFLNKSWEWLNDPEIFFLTKSIKFSKEEQLAWFCLLPEKLDYKIWGIVVLGKPIGAFGLKNITKDKAEYWGYIGEKEYWGKGIGKLMIAHAIKFAKEINLQLLYLKVITENQRAIRLYEKMNFVYIGMEESMLLMCLTLE